MPTFPAIHHLALSVNDLQVSEPWLRSILSSCDSAVWITNIFIDFVAGILAFARHAIRSNPENLLDLFAGAHMQRIYPSILLVRAALAPKTGIHSVCAHGPRPAHATAQSLAFLDMVLSTAVRKLVSSSS